MSERLMSGRIGRTTTDLNMREGPGLDGTIIAVLATGTLFEILDEVGSNWFHIGVAGQDGFVYRSYVQEPKAAKTTREVGVYAAPGVTSAVVTALFEETQLLVFDQEDSWLEVVALGLPGYVQADAVAFPRIGKTTGYVNLRTGPSTETRILEMLPPGTRIHVWDEQEEWVYIADTIRSGHLHKDFVEVASKEVPEGGVGEIPVIGDLSGVALEPAPAERIVLGPNPGKTERQVADIWNRLGGLLKALAAQLAIDPGAAVAVLTVESGGRAFGPDGRMIIRFENHVFYDRWGKDHLEVYQQHFKFNPGQRWTDHYWRPASNQQWRPAHQGQDGEWEVFTFARALNDTAAKSAISMGGPQIMGFNYASLGYASVQQMFEAFSTGERSQVVGLFAFIQGGGAESKRVLALRALDFEAFARSYNGSGQAAKYGALIREVYDTFHRLRG